ncbi:MAG: 2'-5' RNA ligase family protein [Alphaproteobacteria bacterium]|nr:2'-5' RNA ligase family protein [Alphaproteobacteria bacterium]
MPALAVIAEPLLSQAHARRIAAVRRRCDPRFATVPPHVTLVFPIAVADPAAARATVAGIAGCAGAVTARFAGATRLRTAGPRGWLVMLRVDGGAGALARLHHRLAIGPFRGNRRGTAPYRPHLTAAAGLTAPVATRLARRLGRWPAMPCRFAALGLVSWDGRRLERLATVRLGAAAPHDPSLMPFSR